MLRLKKQFHAATLVVLGMCLAGLFPILAELSHQRLGDGSSAVVRSIETQALLRETLTVAAQAEAAERAYLLSGQQAYLAPYLAAPSRNRQILSQLRQLWQAEPAKLAQLEDINNAIGQRFGQLDARIKLYRNQQADSAIGLLRSGADQRDANRLQALVQTVLAQEASQYQQNLRYWHQQLALTRLATALASVLSLILLFALYKRSRHAQQAGEQAAETAEMRNQALEDMVKERTIVLSELSSALQIRQEREKAKLARDIHDEFGSTVISARMDISFVLAKLRDAQPQLAKKLERAIQSLDSSVDIKRRMVEELRPSVLDTFGLPAALEWQVQQACERASMKAELDMPDKLPELPDDVAIALFRITQEALTNIVKYAKAQTVQLELKQTDSEWRLTIKDDGIGLAEGAIHSPLSHGISGMRQRVIGLNGAFAIFNEPEQGVTIVVHVPRPTLPPPAYQAPTADAASQHSNF